MFIVLDFLQIFNGIPDFFVPFIVKLHLRALNTHILRSNTFVRC